MEKSFSNVLAIGTAAAILFAVSGARAGTALDTVKDSNRQVLDIYAAHETIDGETEGRIYEVIDGVTDFAAIADSVTARFCRKLTDAQCLRFNEVFIRLLRVSSIKKLGRYRAESFDYLGEETDGDSAVVRTVAHYRDDRVALDYFLAPREGGWAITNYVVDDVDTIRNYRKQFTRLFAKKSFDQVIERLEGRIATYEQE